MTEELLPYTPDVDECQDGSNDCDENAECSNTVGNYTCSCSHGYTGDGKNCTGMKSYGIQY